MTTIYDYVAEHNPKGSTAILNKYGYKGWDKWEENSNALKELVKKHGEQVLKDVAENHPDANLIIHHYKAPNIVKGDTVTKVTEHANCDACNGSENLNCNGDTKCSKCQANADGATSPSTTNTTTPTDSNKFKFSINGEFLLMLGVIGILALIIKK